MSGDPYRPVDEAPRPTVPLPPPAHPPIARLRRCGATKDEIAEVYRRWAELGPDEKRESVTDLRYATDEELRAALAEMRDPTEPEPPPKPKARKKA